MTERRLVDEALKLISDCPLFQGLSEAQRDVLRARIRLRHYAPGEIIFAMDDAGATLMAIVAGSVQISIPSPEGKELMLTIMHPGDIFGEISLLDGKARTADARAMTACTLAALDRKEVLPLFEENPRAYAAVVALLCERIRRTTTHIAEVALLDLRVRLARALLRAAEIAENAHLPGFNRVTLSQRALGKMVGATRESVNKCLRNWQRGGLIEVKNNTIVLKDIAALKTLADGETT